MLLASVHLERNSASRTRLGSGLRTVHRNRNKPVPGVRSADGNSVHCDVATSSARTFTRRSWLSIAYATVLWTGPSWWMRRVEKPDGYPASARSLRASSGADAGCLTLGSYAHAIGGSGPVAGIFAP